MNKIIKKVIKSSFLYKPIKKIYLVVSNISMRRNIKKFFSGKKNILPSGIAFEPTTKCNLNCRMCYQKQERALCNQDIKLEDVKKSFLPLKGRIKSIGLIGAEVFMRRDIFEMIHYFNTLNMSVYLATNGTLINDENIEELKNCKNVTGIGYSLDGPRDYHNFIRGQSYAYDKLLKAIELTRNNFNTTVNSVIMDDNINYLFEVANIVKDQGVKNYSLQFEMFSTKAELEESARILGIDEKDFAVELKESCTYKFDKGQLFKILNELKKISGLNILIQPNIFNIYPDEYLNGSLREKVKLYCKDMNTLRLNAQGSVILCPFIKREFGNILEQDVSEIWNSEEFINIKKKIISNNLLPICKRCCRLGKM
ncbi:MAG TPA: radical SAM protein [bacterium]|jgi:MoaA/NifB/PqqE/SkfB family radical SAM enzyme|nr:radical SAM protein [bacterium]HOG38134.1 radical SAM protein [bacterium]